MHSRAEHHASRDNITSLEMLLNGAGRGEGLSPISRKLALDLGDGAYRPAVVKDMPDVAFAPTDAISRRFHLERLDASLPTSVRSVQEAQVLFRDASYYFILCVIITAHVSQTGDALGTFFFFFRRLGKQTIMTR